MKNETPIIMKTTLELKSIIKLRNMNITLNRFLEEQIEKEYEKYIENKNK